MATEATLDADNILYHAERLTNPRMAGRLTGTPGEAEAAAYIADYFRQLGLQPGGDDNTYFQTFSIDPVEIINIGTRYRLGRSSGRSLPAENVIGVLRFPRGKPGTLILSAHFDHLGAYGWGVFPGANDNASGVAVMLETARVLAAGKQDAYSTVMFVAFSGEEMGLLGSAEFVRRPPVPLDKVKAVINLDSVGNGRQGTPLLLWGDVNLTRAVTAEAEKMGLKVRYETKEQARGRRSDDSSFTGKVPAVTILAGNWLEKNHTPADTMAILNRQYLEQVGNLTLNTLAQLAREGTTNQFRD